MKKLIFLFSFFCHLNLSAQTVEINGQVLDDQGAPVSNATVTIKGTKTAAVAHVDGRFKINVPGAVKLVVSAVGYESQELDPAGKETLTIVLKHTNSSLSEVVVTALGIKREKKALGYAVSTVGSKELELRPEGDIARVLNGKIPGLDVLNSSGISGSGTSISIRGISTITGTSATPLFVVDGVPFNSDNNLNDNFAYGGGTSTTSRFLDLDPNNIESVSVLKGLSATTLYGETARNGVILITTKNGAGRKTRKKLEVTALQSIFSNQVANLPAYENTYGGGFDLQPSAAFSNWGAKFTDPPLQVPYSTSLINAFPDYASKTQDYKAYKSVENFFRTGIISTSSVNVATSGANSTFNANYSYLDDEGFTPNNRVYKNNFGLGGTAKLANNLSLNAVLNFVITDFKTPILGSNGGGGSADVASVFGDLLYTPRSVNLMGLPYQNPVNGSSIYYRYPVDDIQNPRWTANNALTRDVTYRTYGTFGLKYEILKGLNINYRFGLDLYNELQTLSVNKGGKSGGPGYVNGLYRTISEFNSIFNHNLNLNYVKNLTDKINLSVDAGLDYRRDEYNQTGLKSTQQIVFGLFDHSNFITHDILSEGANDLDYKIQEVRIGAYAQAVLGYQDYLFLTLNGRNDWVSTLEAKNRHLFYPGISASFIPSSLWGALKNSSAVNYLKLRIGYSTSAHFPNPYNTRPSLDIVTNAFVDRNGNVVNTGAIPDNVPNPDLKPELLKEIEAGIEGKFLNSRLSLDLTGYSRTATDQILSRQLDASTGYTTTTINAGAVDNKGIELSLGYAIVSSAAWKWELTGIFTLNKNRVHDMPSDIKQIQTGGYAGQVGTYAVNGQPLGVIKGTYIQKDPKSGLDVVDNNGYYLQSADIQVIGDPNPKYKLTGISNLTYKNFSFHMQWDYTHGGQIFSNTVRTLLSRGVTRDTDFDRSQPYVLPKTVKQDGTTNDIQQSVDNIYFNSLGFGPDETGIYDATIIRLRELSLSYSLPAGLLKNTPFGSVSITVSGNNIWYLAPNFPKYTHEDPEINSLGAGTVRGLDLFAGPSSRRIGGSIIFTF